MARVTDEQIQEARNISLLEYFQTTDPGGQGGAVRGQRVQDMGRT